VHNSPQRGPVLLSEVSALLKTKYGHPGPGQRKLVQLAADAVISPPVEKINGRWACTPARMPALVQLLRELGLMPPANDADFTRRTSPLSDCCIRSS
jgi:hypothetical protein